MIANILTVSPEVREEAKRMAKEIFGEESNPDYLQVTKENVERLKCLSPDSILYEVEDNTLLGWVVVVPTTKDLAEKFVGGEITEQRLVELTKPSDKYEVVYLCAAGIKPEYRRKGIALKLLREALARMPMYNEDYGVYSWPVTSEGQALNKKLEAEIGKVLHLKQ